MKKQTGFTKEEGELMEDAAAELAGASGRSVAEVLADLERTTRKANELPTGFDTDVPLNPWAADEAVYRAAIELLESLKQGKPDERSEKARRYAVAITEAEKLFAWVSTWIIDSTTNE